MCKRFLEGLASEKSRGGGRRRQGEPSDWDAGLTHREREGKEGGITQEEPQTTAYCGENGGKIKESPRPPLSPRRVPQQEDMPGF